MRPATVAVRAVGARSTHRASAALPGRQLRTTTILCVRKGNKVCMMGDNQVTLGEKYIAKGTAKKLRRAGDNVLVGFAGSTADAMTLLEKLEGKLTEFPGQLLRACVELAKEWRSDRAMRKLNASMIVASETESLEIDGLGNVITPEEDGVIAIGSGGLLAKAAARALVPIEHMEAEEICLKSIKIAASIDVFTNENFHTDMLIKSDKPKTLEEKQAEEEEERKKKEAEGPQLKITEKPKPPEPEGGADKKNDEGEASKDDGEKKDDGPKLKISEKAKPAEGEEAKKEGEGEKEQTDAKKEGEGEKKEEVEDKKEDDGPTLKVTPKAVAEEAKKDGETAEKKEGGDDAAPKLWSPDSDGDGDGSSGSAGGGGGSGGSSPAGGSGGSGPAAAAPAAISELRAAAEELRELRARHLELQERFADLLSEHDDASSNPQRSSIGSLGDGLSYRVPEDALAGRSGGCDDPRYSPSTGRSEDPRYCSARFA